MDLKNQQPVFLINKYYVIVTAPSPAEPRWSVAKGRQLEVLHIDADDRRLPRIGGVVQHCGDRPGSDRF